MDLEHLIMLTDSISIVDICYWSGQKRRDKHARTRLKSRPLDCHGKPDPSPSTNHPQALFRQLARAQFSCHVTIRSHIGNTKVNHTSKLLHRAPLKTCALKGEFI